MTLENGRLTTCDYDLWRAILSISVEMGKNLDVEIVRIGSQGVDLCMRVRLQLLLLYVLAVH